MKKRLLTVMLTVLLCIGTLLQFAACGCTHKNTIKDKSVEATCTTTGLTEGSHCVDCGKILVEQKVVPAKSHTFVTKSGKVATCQQTGLTDGKYCSICGYVSVAQKVVAKTNCVEGSDGYCVMCKAILNPYRILENYFKNNCEYKDGAYQYITTLSADNGIYYGIFYYPETKKINATVLGESDSFTSYATMMFEQDINNLPVVFKIEYDSGYKDSGSGYIKKSTVSHDNVYIYNFSYKAGISSSLKDSVKELWTSQTKIVLSTSQLFLWGIDENLTLRNFGFSNY